MPTFPNYRGELPGCLNPFKLHHYFLLAYWVYFRPSALQCYLYQANPDVYQMEGVGKLRGTWLAKPYRNLYLMLPGTIILLVVLVGLVVLLCTNNTVFGHNDPVNTVAVVSEQQVISASSDGTLKVWDLKRGTAFHTLGRHAGSVTALAVTPDGQRAISGSGDRTLKVWELNPIKRVNTLKGHTRWIAAVDLLPENRAISASGDSTLKVWDLKRGKAVYTLSGHTAPVTDVAVTSDGQMGISASSDNTLKVWDLTRGTELHTLTGHTATVTDVAVLPGQQRAISASGDRTLKVWDLLTGKELHTLTGHTDWVRALAVTPDGFRAISASSDSTLKVWDITSGTELNTLTGHTGWVNVVLSTPNGQQAISASSDRTIKVWDLQRGKELHTLTGHTSWVTAMGLLSGERLISAANNGFLKVWNLSSGTQVPIGGPGIQFLWSLALGLASGLVVLAVILTTAVVLTIGVMAFGVAGSVISGVGISLVGSLVFIMADLLVQHIVQRDPSFRQTYAGISISVWLLIVAAIAFGLTISAAFGLTNRKALGVVGSVLFILVIGLLVGVAVAGIVNKSAISVRGRLLPGYRTAIQLGVVFNWLVFLGAIRALFYPFQLGLALRSTVRGKEHPVESDELVVLPLPGTRYCLQKRLQRDELSGLLMVADVVSNPFQRAWAQQALQTYLHRHPAPLHFLYGLFSCPDLNTYVYAPVSQQDWQQLPTTRQLLLGELSGKWVDCSSDGSNRMAERLIWLLTWLCRDRRQTPLTSLAGMLYQLSYEKAVHVSDFDLSHYYKTYASLTQYPGGVEIAHSFEVLATFLAYDRLSALPAAVDVISEEGKIGDSSESAIRPEVLKALSRLGEIGASVATYQAATSQVNQLAALAHATSALDDLDEYVVAEVVSPEQTILRRIIRQWRQLVSKKMKI